MIKFVILLLLVTFTTPALAFIGSEFSGNLDAQAKGLKNTNTAKDKGQDWNNENMYLIYSNIKGRLIFRKAKLNINWFLRYSISDLYKNDYVAPRFSVFPNNVIHRDIFKLQKIDEADGAVSESILNEFNYEWGDDETIFKFGRMAVNFGEGYVFNPINPFMLPTAFSTLQNIAQGNDGLKFYIKSQNDFRIHLYIFGDKQFTDYDGKITRTLMFRGDWDYSDQIHINYILGEDQKRHKYGFEIRYAFDRGQIFGQAVRNSQRLDKEDPSDNGLFHYLLGYEKDLTNIWTGRVEFGKYDSDNSYVEADYNQNFLPQKNFIAFINSLKLTDLVKAQLNGSIDPKSGFSYFHMDVNHQYSKAMQFHVFMSGPISRAKDKPEYSSQRVFAGELGLGFRSVF